MIPLSLRLRRCRSWQELDLDLPEGVTALTGPNGAGKSTVVNALDIALFGPESRSLADLYPWQGGTDEMQIEFTFEHGGSPYRIRRSFSPKGRGASKLDFDVLRAPDRADPLTLESQQATQDRIERLLGLSRESFRASSFLAQGQAGVFCEAAPRDRKSILQDILGLQQWQEWLDRARAAKREAESELDRLAGAHERAEAELAERAALQSQRDEARSQAATAEQMLADASVALAAARQALEAEERAKTERSEIEAAVLRTQRIAQEQQQTILTREREIATIEAALERRDILTPLAESLPALEAEQDQLRAAEQQVHERDRIVQRHHILTGQIHDLAQYAETLEARAVAVLMPQEIAPTCDRCGQTLPDDAAERAAASYREDARKAGVQAQALQQESDQITDRLAELDGAAWDPQRADFVAVAILEARTAAAELVAARQAEKRLLDARVELDELRAGLERREADLGAASAALDLLGPHDPMRLPTLTQQVLTAGTSEKAARQQRDEAMAQLARLQERLDRLDQLQADLDRDRQRRDTLTADLDLYTALERACGPNGVPALILESQAIPQIETEANRILGLLGGPAYAVELRTLREKKTGGLSDTLDIVLLTENGEADYRSFSGGERARVAFALRLALAQLLASRRGARSGLLVIDEIDGLDGQGVAALVDVLEGLQQHVPTILVVSHDPSLRDAFQHSLTLERGEDGWSRIADGA